jgi:hypothetical protein
MNRHLYVGGRVALAVIFLVMGADYFVSFLPEAPSSPRGTAFLEALLATGYLFPLIKIVEIACGLLLLSGRAVLPALLLVAPVSVNIALYHAVLDRNGAWLGFLASGLTFLLLWPFRAPLAALFSAKPRLSESSRVAVAADPVFLADSRQSS